MKKALIIVAVLLASVSAVAAPSVTDALKAGIQKLFRGKSGASKVDVSQRVLSREQTERLVQRRRLAVADSGTRALVSARSLFITRTAKNGSRTLQVDIPTNGDPPLTTDEITVVNAKVRIKDSRKRESSQEATEEAFSVKQSDSEGGAGAHFKWTADGELDYADVNGSTISYTSVRIVPGEYYFSANKRFITRVGETPFLDVVNIRFETDIHLATDEVLESIKSIDRVGNKTDRLQLQIVVRNTKPGSAPSVRDILVKVEDEVTLAMDGASRELAIEGARSQPTRTR